MLIYQPYDREVITELSTDDAESVESKLRAASEVFSDRANWLRPFQRLEILKRIASLVQREEAEFSMLIAREGGKPLMDARVEVGRAIKGIELAISAIEFMAGEEIPMGLTEASKDRWAFTIKEPIGIVAAISSFNHPLNLIVHQVIPAIAVGCPVIVKPAPTTPLTCLRVVELFREAGLPEPWCQTVILNDNRLAEALATDPRVAFLSFIGSAKVGWYLRSRLAAGSRCSLEHGGTAPVIVDRSADVEQIIEPLVKGGYYHAGQVCVSTQRIFVHRSLLTSFLDRFAARVESLRVGDPTDLSTEVGPLILPFEVDRVESWVNEARETGGRITVGGTRLGSTMFRPTVVVEPSSKAKISQLEVFGPVTSVYAFTELSDAIAKANSLPTAFQAAIFTQDLDRALLTATLLDASAVMVNDHTAFRTDWMPFAGRRQSGYGVGGIQHTMREMTQSKMIVLRLQQTARHLD